MTSKCCGSNSLGQIHDGIGFCGDCKDHAEFEMTCSMCGDVAVEDDLCRACEMKEEGGMSAQEITELTKTILRAAVLQEKYKNKTVIIKTKAV